MLDLDLQANEGIILQRDYVHRAGDAQNAANAGTLVLTNLNLIFLKQKGVFITSTETFKYPINQIKVINGQAQAILGEDRSEPALQVLLKNQQVLFKFSNAMPGKAKKEITNWIDQINQLLGTTPMPSTNTGTISNALKSTFGTVKDTLGIKSKEPETVTTKCIGCMAPIAGKKGQVVRCKYCDTEQTL